MNHTSTKPPATVRLVAESEATGRVREIYEDIKATKQIDFVPNFWQALASHPPLLDQVWVRLKSIMHTPGKLDPLVKEMIALAVSATNGCTYCINSHTAAVKKLGLDDAGLGELMSVVALFNTTNTLADGYQVQPDIFPPQA
jgi:AhpD family alkylhydroperoxidase